MPQELTSSPSAGVEAPPAPSWAVAQGLLVVGVAPTLPVLLGSAVNIWYNLIHIEPLLTPAQHAVFLRTILVFNLAVYPPAVSMWVWILRSLGSTFNQALRGQTVAPDRLERARRRVINLPWWVLGIAGPGWLLCIPVFLLALRAGPDPVDPRLYAHLPTSFLISAMIAITHSLFVVEILSQRLLYPVFFQNARPAETPGAWALSLRGRGLLWAVSAGVCPIGSLLLLALGPRHPNLDSPWFALSVGGLGIAFGLTTAWLVSRLVAEPVDALRRAAQAVAAGDLDTRIPLLRADEFGPLIDEFNHMVSELREKLRIQETFGRHVGRHAARQILEADPGLGGVTQEVTIVFVDIRNFTARSERATPDQVVSLLNLFLTEMVDVVEQSGGMVNKFLGDGFMALFSASTGRPDQADAAVQAGQDMLGRLDAVNRELASRGHEPLAIGIGIHTGPAVVGSIGSPKRMEYTAIGDTVNVASRVESLTKVVGAPLVFTDATRRAFRKAIPADELPPQRVKGQSEPLVVFRPVS